MYRDDFVKLNSLTPNGLLSSELGAFSVEVESSQFIALSPKKYIHRLNDGTFRVRYSGRKLTINNPWGLFEALYTKVTTTTTEATEPPRVSNP
jgi:hypothetical protein